MFTTHNDRSGIDVPDIVLSEASAPATDEPSITLSPSAGILSPRGTSSPIDIGGSTRRERAGSLTASIRKKLSVHVHAELSLSPRKSVEVSGNIATTKKSNPFGSLNCMYFSRSLVRCLAYIAYSPQYLSISGTAF